MPVLFWSPDDDDDDDDDDDGAMRREKSWITWPPVPSHPGTEYLVRVPPHLDNMVARFSPTKSFGVGGG